MEKTLDTLVWEGVAVSISKIVSGGATGADALAESYAKLRDIPIQVFPADWDTHGRAAGPIRNRQIVKASDLIVAFWDGKSPGTRSTKGLTEKAGKPFLHVKI